MNYGYNFLLRNNSRIHTFYNNYKTRIKKMDTQRQKDFLELKSKLLNEIID